MILKLIAVGILTVVFLIDGGSAAQKAEIDVKLYPEAERDETVRGKYPDGTDIVDPYRWLEDVDSDKSTKFIHDQNAFTEDYFKRIENREQIKARYEELWHIEKYEGPFLKGDKYYSYRSTDADKQDILYVHDNPMDDGREFLDPNNLDDGSILQKTSSAFSENGKVFAYLTDSGSNSNTIRFKTSEEEGLYTEKLTNVKNSKITWMKNDGIFYSYYGNPKASTSSPAGTSKKTVKLNYHILGTDQNYDITVVEFEKNPDYHISSDISEDGKYLIVTASQGDRDVVYVADLEALEYKITSKLQLTQIVPDMIAKFDFVTNINTKFIFRTSKGAINNKLVSVDITDLTSWKDLVQQERENILDWAKPASDKYLVLGYIGQDIRSVLQLHSVESGLRILTFELDVGSVKPESFYSDKKSNDIYFKFESFFTPCIIYHYNLSDTSSPKPEKIKEITVPNFDASEYTFEFTTFESKDKVKIPMYITYKKDIQKKQSNFCFLTANGGFGVNLLPYFSINRIVVLKNLNGVHAVPNIRGGREKGIKWHQDGSKRNKQNSIDDFTAAGDFLVQQGYTWKSFLVADGGATGTSGPLMGAAINQRPDLFKVVIAEAGTMDMLRFNQFNIGQEWVSEYGSPKDIDDFTSLKKYSPLHNVKITYREYPATLLVTSVYDERVPSPHSFKFLATLQNEANEKAKKQKNPLLIKLSKVGMTSLEEAVDIASFIVLNTDVKFNP